MSISELIKREPVTINEGASLIEAIKLMVSEDVGSLVIVRDKKPVGIITERDILRALARGLKPDEPVERVGTINKLITIEVDGSISEAATKMRENRIRHLIVLDKDGSLKGVISVRDLVYEEEFIRLISESGI